MAFFDDLNSAGERSPRNDVQLRHLGATSAVLKYAPPRLRAAALASAKDESEVAYWRQRAYRAEAQLVTLEARIRRLAALARGRVS